MNLEVRTVSPEIRDALLALEVLPEHVDFAGLSSQTLPLAEADPFRIPMAVLESGQSEAGRVIGFFVLCWGEQISHFASSANTMGFRAYVIDTSKQDRGYGTAVFAALQEFLLEHHPEYTELNLTVNIKNPRAYRVYLRAGFEDSGELYHGGAFGPQHVLSLKLRPA